MSRGPEDKFKQTVCENLTHHGALPEKNAGDARVGGGKPDVQVVMHNTFRYVELKAFDMTQESFKTLRCIPTSFSPRQKQHFIQMNHHQRAIQDQTAVQSLLLTAYGVRHDLVVCACYASKSPAMTWKRLFPDEAKGDRNLQLVIRHAPAVGEFAYEMNEFVVAFSYDPTRGGFDFPVWPILLPWWEWRLGIEIPRELSFTGPKTWQRIDSARVFEMRG